MSFLRKIRIAKIIVGVLVISALWALFSYKLLDIPPNMTFDEAAFGYNGILLEKTLHDENGRFLPFFVLSLNGRDWRQPITQYANALAFKIFGPSFYVARGISVFIMILSAALIFYLLNDLYETKLAFLGTLLFIFTPILMIQSHMDLDNIAPVPFAIVWLTGIHLFSKSKELRFLVLSGFMLGVSFYSYKAMRLIVPVWSVLSVLYLPFYYKHFDKRVVTAVLAFSLSILPFYIIIPFLEAHYPGAVFDRQSVSPILYQHFFLGLFSNLDPSFLFIKGDSTPYHSVGLYGSLLLASFPFFLLGAYKSIEKKGIWIFSLAAFTLGPALFGLANSWDRSSRLLALIPPYIVVCSLGVWVLSNLKNKVRIALLFVLFVLVFLNYFDFVRYYWCCYSKFYKTQEAFGVSSYVAYLSLAQEAQRRDLRPAVEASIYSGGDVLAKFYEAAYFQKPFILWQPGEALTKNSILLTNSERLSGMRKLDLKLPAYHILVASDKN